MQDCRIVGELPVVEFSYFKQRKNRYLLMYKDFILIYCIYPQNTLIKTIELYGDNVPI